MTNEEPAETVEGLFSESRRSVLKKGAVATGALAVGVGSTQSGAAQENGHALVYTRDYWPDAELNVIDSMPSSTVVYLLRDLDNELVAEIGHPEDYNGYIVEIPVGEDERPNMVGTLFTQQKLTVDREDPETVTLEDDGQVFSQDLGLIQANLDENDDEDDDDDDEDDDDNDDDEDDDDNDELI